MQILQSWRSLISKKIQKALIFDRSQAFGERFSLRWLQHQELQPGFGVALLGLLQPGGEAVLAQVGRMRGGGSVGLVVLVVWWFGESTWKSFFFIERR